MDVDVIVALSGGRVVERGTHRELLAAGDLYARLWALQLREARTRERAHETRVPPVQPPRHSI